MKFGGGFGWIGRVRVCRALGLRERGEKRWQLTTRLVLQRMML